MSEYWKSTPKYWCKHCKTYVRDTAFEKTQHEATGKHQGSLKRFLRDVHRGQDREEKDSQRAKNEIQRLNRLVTAPNSSDPGQAQVQSQSNPPWKRTASSIAAAPAAGGADSSTKEGQKKQLAQLVDMGVAIPQEFRPEMAMAGEWEVISKKTVGGDNEQNDDGKAVNKGVRKRKFEGENEDLENMGEARKAWGSAIRKYPGGNAKQGADDDEELDALLNMKTELRRERKLKVEEGVGVEKREDEAGDNKDAVVKDENDNSPPFKQEIKEEEENSTSVLQPEDTTVKNERGSTTAVPPVIKSEDSTEPIPKPTLDEIPAEPESAASTIVFKKRKPKQIKR